MSEWTEGSDIDTNIKRQKIVVKKPAPYSTDDGAGFLKNNIIYYLILINRLPKQTVFSMNDRWC